MAYDETLAGRLRRLLGARDDVAEKRMFGGLTFMVAGHMCCGVTRDELVLRLGKAGAAAAVAKPHVRYCDFTGRPMKTMVTIAHAGFAGEAELGAWVRLAVDFAETESPR